MCEDWGWILRLGLTVILEMGAMVGWILEMRLGLDPTWTQVRLRRLVEWVEVGPNLN